ncbi:hypothetical protein BFP97_06335 [Roseivirga sp. 4D4]|uniref:hypothetical protein n=1 Tax=Roseivirga sp. 4D4 TaxID=1889784 RepID=UPI000853BC4D|nr:hypothetical protein [Roseivirga sp. 4D4]OEK01149.1 hypothetical protein BFP97_06335 [Roseivirga sp. 4D4]
MSKWDYGRYIIQFEGNSGLSIDHHFMRVFKKGNQKWFQIDDRPSQLLDKDAVDDLRYAHIRRAFDVDERPTFQGTKIYLRTSCGVCEFKYKFKTWKDWEHFIGKFPGIKTNLESNGN